MITSNKDSKAEKGGSSPGPWNKKKKICITIILFSIPINGVGSCSIKSFSTNNKIDF